MKRNVLFLCTGNSCRSQMAEALLRARGGERYEALSAGMEPKGVHPFTLRVLEEIDVPTAGLESKHVSQFLGHIQVHVLIVVCDGANESCPRIFPGMRERLFWPFDDPASATGIEAERLEVFRRVRDEIDQRIRTWLATEPTA